MPIDHDLDLRHRLIRSLGALREIAPHVPKSLQENRRLLTLPKMSVKLGGN